MFTDAHAHPYDIFMATGSDPDLANTSRLCASSHDTAEFLWNEGFASRVGNRIVQSFGIHPQNPDLRTLSFLDGLARDGRIAAVGEAGYDLFDDNFRSTLYRQREAWAAQLEIARNRDLALVVHCRKAMDRIFADARSLSRLRAVIFHGWPGSSAEALALLSRGVNGWFSAGKGLLRGDKSLMATVSGLGPERVLAETDAPWMTLRGEKYSVPADIEAVHAFLAKSWGIPLETAAERIAANFNRAYGIGR